MKRIHIGLRVDDISASAGFYSTLFGVEPSVLKDDYAKWMLDDPRVNFSITTRDCDSGGPLHFGVQVENAEELTEVTGRLKDAGLGARETPEVTCCYAKSDKTWTVDPQGLPWETFLTHGLATVYGDDTIEAADIDGLIAERAARGAAAEDPGAKPAKVGACCG